MARGYDEVDLKFHLELVLKEAMNEIAEITKDELQRIVDRDWYMRSGYSLGTYERTYQLIDSITADIIRDDGYFLYTHIYFDLTKILPEKRLSGFNAHMSLNEDITYGGESISWWLVNWIEYGNKGALGNNPIQGIAMLERTSEYVRENIDRITRRVFRRKGLSLVRAG